MGFRGLGLGGFSNKTDYDSTEIRRNKSMNQTEK